MTAIFLFIFYQLHFDFAHGAYLDFGNHTEKVCCLFVVIPLRISCLILHMFTVFYRSCETIFQDCCTDTDF